MTSSLPPSSVRRTGPALRTASSGGSDDALRLAAEELAVGADHVDVKGVRHRVPPAGLFDGFGFCQHFVDGADHVEGLLRDVVVLAINDALEATDGFFERHVFAG